MNKTFTQNDLILFLYNELPQNERIALVNELTVNVELREELNEMASVLQIIDGQEFKPSDTSVAIIIEDSLSSHLEMH